MTEVKRLARRKKEEEHTDTGGWLNTFADLMNLLLCFFVMLFAMSTVDTEKFQEVIASFSNSYSILSGGGSGIGDGVLISSGASQLNALSEYYNNMGLNSEGESNDLESAVEKVEQAEIAESEQIAENVQSMLDKSGLGNVVEVQATTHYVLLTLKGTMMFESAKADLTDDARKILDQIAPMLELYQKNMIEIEGHTDNVPINGEIFKDNDTLSDYRALAVFHYLVNDKGLSPVTLKHSGRGEYDPVASNDTAEGRSQNRRVEIKIYNSISSKD